MDLFDVIFLLFVIIAVVLLLQKNKKPANEEEKRKALLRKKISNWLLFIIGLIILFGIAVFSYASLKMLGYF
jgi:heme/copper-type cytochrome/quinol oxidase subunit 2